MHLLVVEDDARLGRLLKRLLEGDRHLVELTATGNEALDVAGMAGLDGMILDIGLPDISGLEVARRPRDDGNRTPILMLTARDAVGDRVRGLDSGADDYLVKPFATRSSRHDCGRSAARARRSGTGAAWFCATARSRSTRSGARSTSASRPVELSPREFSLLECFLRHPGQVLTRQQLLDHAWPYGDFLTENSVDTYVHYLRDKLGDGASTRILTVRGVGYRMAEA